jgi:hypothetical protein
MSKRRRSVAAPLFAATIVIASLALLGSAGDASSRAPRPRGAFTVGIFGWGNIRFARVTEGCRVDHCTGSGHTYVSLMRRVTMTAQEPWKGWKFSGWQGGCKTKKPKCVIDFAHIRRKVAGVPYTWIHAKFVPAVPGIARSNPIPIGTTGTINYGPEQNFQIRVNSVTPNFDAFPSPEPPPPPGAEYFVATVTMTYTGGGSAQAGVPSQVIGSHNKPYVGFPNGQDDCPDWPMHPFPPNQTLYSGQSVTGDVCWTIAANDQSSLELYFGSGSINYPGTTWFALH